MSDLNTQAVARYKNNFLKEVEERVEEGHWVKMCMQCGVCAGSCPLGTAWEHTPQKIFMMIRAGKREAVLRSDAMFMCTSCYSCVVRCPRELPITHIYKSAFEQTKFDYAAALTVVQFGLLLLLTYAANKAAGGNAGAVEQD